MQHKLVEWAVNHPVNQHSSLVVLALSYSTPHKRCMRACTHTYIEETTQELSPDFPKKNTTQTFFFSISVLKSKTK